MLTKQFKVTAATILGIAGLSGIALNEANVHQRLAAVEKAAQTNRVVLVSPTAVPTASPSASPTVVFKNALPKATVTVVLSPTVKPVSK